MDYFLSVALLLAKQKRDLLKKRRFWPRIACSRSLNGTLKKNGFGVNGLSSVLVTQGLLVTDLVILNHGQVTWTTPEMTPSSPNFHTTPTKGRLSLDIFNVHRSPLNGGSSEILGSNSLHTGYESVTLIVAAVAEWYRYRTVACFVTVPELEQSIRITPTTNSRSLPLDYRSNCRCDSLVFMVRSQDQCCQVLDTSSDDIEETS
ncbi:hypothetical protein TNCV_3431001 [Trichonephila clavipes]|nr:hypothetical protein TNCV_3431001 [Trichonephila clavipes]